MPKTATLISCCVLHLNGQRPKAGVASNSGQVPLGFGVCFQSANGHLGAQIPHDLWRIDARMRFSPRGYTGKLPLGEYFSTTLTSRPASISAIRRPNAHLK